MKRVLVVALSMLGVLLLLQPAAMADEVTMQLTGSPTYDNNGGVYTDPYAFEVSGIKGTVGAIPLDLACDDFEKEIYFGDAWEANLYVLNTLSTPGYSLLKFGAGAVVDPTTGQDFESGDTPISYSAPELYYAAALLADQLFTLPNDTHYGANSAELSYAIWQIFDTTAYTHYDPVSTGLTVADLSGKISTALDSAVTNSGNAATLGFTLDVYTPCSTGTGTCDTPPNKGASQEFLGVHPIPEGSTLPFLPLDLLVLSGAAFLVRKRILAN
jgi:hypothetical protein